MCVCPNMDWIFIEFFEMIWFEHIALTHSHYLVDSFRHFNHLHMTLTHTIYVTAHDTNHKGENVLTLRSDWTQWMRNFEQFPSIIFFLSHYLPLMHRWIIIVGLLKVDRWNIQWCWIELIDFHCRIFWYFSECIFKWIQFVRILSTLEQFTGQTKKFLKPKKKQFFFFIKM